MLNSREMLVIAAPGRQRRTLTIWRCEDAVYAQTPDGRPRAFASLDDLLASLRPASQTRPGWMRLLGLTG